MQVKYNNKEFNVQLNSMLNWQDFEIALAIKKSALNELKRTILKCIKRNKNLVNELLQVENIEQELEKIPSIDLSNIGMHKSHTPFKIIK